MPAAKKKAAARAPKHAIVAVPDFIKVSIDGKKLPVSAKDWAATICTKYRNARGLPLMFTARDIGRHDFDAALKTSEGFELMGFKDWYQPDATESNFMLDRSKYPAMDSQFFIGDAGWQWTRTPHASGSDCAFFVNLSYGGVLYGHRYHGGLVRACREVSARQCLAFGIPVGPRGAKGKR